MSIPAVFQTKIPATVTILALAAFAAWAWAPSVSVPSGVSSAEAATNDMDRDVMKYVRELHTDAGISYPPKGITLIAFKEEEVLELWAETEGGPVPLKTYEFCAASGQPGPKLCRGDCQVPEGVYGVANLNPNSKFHLSLLLDYPNEFDREKGKTDGRTDLGSAICIHGGCKSIGCIALGDEAIEEIFLIASDVGARNCRTIIAPYDFRTQGLPARYTKSAPAWIGELYESIDAELRPYAPAFLAQAG